MTDTGKLAAAQTIYERMVSIIGELPAIGKNQKNPQQGFMFRGHDDVLNALNPLLSSVGVFVVPNVVERITSERTTAKGTTMYEVNLHVRYTFYGLSGDSIIASAWGEGTDMGDKATNKAMTMAFKNVLNQAFAISTAETQDADSQTPDHSVRQEDPRAGQIKRARGWADWEERMVELLGAREDVNEWLRQACAAIGIESLSQVTSEERKQVFNRANRLLMSIAELGTGFPPPDDDTVRGLVAEAFDGAAVEGPARIEWPERDEATV